MAKNDTKSKKDEKETAKVDSNLSMFDKAAKSVFTLMDKGYDDREVLDVKDRKVRDILNRELDIAKGVSQGSIVDFISSMNLNNSPNGMQNKNSDGLDPATNELFTRNINDIFMYFKDMYANRFLEMSDLKFISKFLPSLGEAVRTVLDGITSSDDLSETINRQIVLPEGIAEEDRAAIELEIERQEDSLKLLPKLKNVVYKNTLVTGMYYVYAVSYNRIFEEYSKIKTKETHGIQDDLSSQFGGKMNKKNAENAGFGSFKNAQNNIVVKEGYNIGENCVIDLTEAMENVRDILSTSDRIDAKDDKKLKRLDKATIDSTINAFMDQMPTITMEASNVYMEAIDEISVIAENQDAMEAFIYNISKKMKDGEGDNSNIPENNNPLELSVPDGTYGTNKRTGGEKFEIQGTYIKYISAKELIPLKVFDQVIGYYLIHPRSRKKDAITTAGEVSGINSIGNTLFSAVNIGETKKHDAINRIVDTISDGILNSFNKKWVTDNIEYKKLIADCIIANGLTDKDYNIQFIPADDIIPFIIQEDEQGFGTSMLADSLFSSKLQLSMVVTRLLNYINKTGNKTIAHVHRGPVNTFDSNQIQRIIRDLQDQDVTFNDLLSPNLVFNKFNRDGNMVIPTARDGTKVIELETQEGQNIDMTPDYEKELDKMTMLGSGVPPAVMEQWESIDFSKQVVSSHIKHAGRIATYQADLEDPTTLLYKKIIANSNLTDEHKIICSQGLEIKLPRPKVLKNMNNSDFLSTILQNAESLADTQLGRETIADTEKNPNGPRVKEILMKKIVQKDTPFFDWEGIQHLEEEARIEVEKEVMSRAKKEDDTEAPGSGMGDDIM